MGGLAVMGTREKTATAMLGMGTWGMETHRGRAVRLRQREATPDRMGLGAPAVTREREESWMERAG